MSKKSNKKVNDKVQKEDIESSELGIICTMKKNYQELKYNPREYLRNLFGKIKKYVYNNKFFILFVFLNVLNAFLLRFFTVRDSGNVYNLETILADFSFVVIIGSFSYFFKKNGKAIYLIVWTFILSIICLINSAYYTFYTSFSSISLLSTARFITSVGDAVVENVLQPKDLIYIIMPFVMIYFNHHYKKNLYYEESQYLKKSKTKASFTLLAGVISLFVFASSLTATDIGRLTKQWNREYIVMRYGIYIYHVNDFVKSMEPKFASLFGYDSALKNFTEYYKDKEKEKTNEYTGIFEGKNIIVIHGESVQNFLIGLTINGQEVTPNLNKLASKGLYFSNYYSQVSVGTSSDTEFTFNTSLMPASIGTAFVEYYDKEYVSIPKLLKEKGYFTFAMHGNNGDYWNRRVMHANLGYDKLIAKSEYNIDEVIGLGISDVSFLRQSVEKLKEINEQNKKWYGTVITLTNHTPFSDTDKYGEFDVSMNVNVLNEETGLEEEKNVPFMEGTKLGNYFKSVHYADYALGQFFTSLSENGLLDNTVIVFYGDHDARLPMSDYIRFYNYDPNTDGIKEKDDPTYVEFNDYSYELNRKVPFIIYSKDNEENAKEIKNVMGMYDAMPTLGNMFGFSNKYALGHDIFNIKDKNIVIFPYGDWVTNDMYYNSQKDESYILNNSVVIGSEYITERVEYADKLLEVSNDILVYDLIRNSKKDVVNESQVVNGAINE